MITDRDAIAATVQDHLRAGHRRTAFLVAHRAVAADGDLFFLDAAFVGAITTGHFEEAFDLFDTHGKELLHAEMLPYIAQMMTAGGWPERLVDLRFYEFFLRDPGRAGALCGPLLRAGIQLAERDNTPPAVGDFATLLLRNADKVTDGYTLASAAQIAATQDGPATDALNALAATPPDHPAMRAELARAGVIEAEGLTDGFTDAPKETVFPSRNTIPRFGLGRARQFSTEDAGSAHETPSLRRKALEAGISAAVDAVLDHASAHPASQKMLQTLQDAALSPVCVLSTGRVGTKALDVLANGSDRLASFHFLGWHWEAGDLNALFYLMLSGTTDPAAYAPFAIRFVADRFPELYFCAVNGLNPVIVNHLDTVLAPFYLGLFPKTRLLHAVRDETKTMLSLAYKQQFNYAQLRHLEYAWEDGTGLFEYRRHRPLSLAEECAWYMTATETLAGALCDTVGPNRFLRLEMDDLFGGDRDTIGRVLSFLGADDLDIDAARALFSKPINQKSHYEPDATDAEIAALPEVLSDVRDRLARSGRLTPDDDRHG